MGFEFGIGGVGVDLRRAATFLPQLAAALAAGFVAGALTDGGDAVGTIVIGAYLVAGWYSARAGRWRWLLPMAGTLSYLTLPLLGSVLAILALEVLAEPVSMPAILGAALAGLAILVLGTRWVTPLTRIRVGVIGSPREAIRLGEELSSSGGEGFSVVATIVPDEWDLDPVEAVKAPYVVALSQIGRGLDERGIEVLVVTREFPREEVDRLLYEVVVARPVQLLELHEFHEHRFGSVPLAEIDYAWFASLAGRHYRPLTKLVKRGLDLAIAVSLLVLLAPFLAIAAIAIRRDGGPALFSQERVGEGGGTFTIHKLRTMSHDPGRASTWTTGDDDRITRVGALLRKTHLDEAPQLWNIIRGEMSFVGPRPEQRSYVERLSEQLPFYNQRHVVKPGLTGWAQVRVGYAGTLEGTAFKLCNDLYYVKNMTLSLDLTIMLETLRTLVADRQYIEPPATSHTMLGEGERRVLIDSAPPRSGP